MIHPVAEHVLFIRSKLDQDFRDLLKSEEDKKKKPVQKKKRTLEYQQAIQQVLNPSDAPVYGQSGEKNID